MPLAAGKRATLFTLAAGIALFIGAGVLIKDRLREEWCLYHFKSASGEETWARASELRGMGPRARRTVEDWYIGRLERWKGDDRRRAAENLAEMGSLRSIPSLLRALARDEADPGFHSWQNYPFAWRALDRIHSSNEKGVVAALVRELSAADADTRRWAAKFFTTLGPLGMSAFPQLKETLQDPDERVRADAAWALFEMGAEKEFLLPVLVQLLEATELQARGEAAAVIELLGPEAGPAIPVLVGPLRKAASSGTYDRALDALAAIGAGAVEPLMRLLDDADGGVRFRAADVLGKIGPEAAPAVPALMRALQDRDLQVLRSATTALGRIGRAARPAVPGLLSALIEDRMRASAIAALARIGPGSEAVPRAGEAVKVLEETLQREFGFNTAWEACLLGLLEPKQEAAQLERLLALLAVADTEVRAVAAETLGCLGSGAGEALQTLLQLAVHDPDGSVRRNASRALGRIGLEDLTPLITTLGDKQLETRLHAAEALAELGARAAPAVPALIRALDDDEGRVRAKAALALGNIGPGARAAVPALKVGLNNSFRSFRENAQRAIKRIEGR